MSDTNENKRTFGAAGAVRIPLGLEHLLYRAASDGELRALLVADPEEAARVAGVELRPAERAMLGTVGARGIEAMVARVRPDSPRRRRFMEMVAASVAALAAGTIAQACGESDTRRYVDAGMDGETDADADSDGDSDTDSGTDTDTGSATDSSSRR